MRLDGIGRPRGWLAPTTTISLDVVARDGERTRFEPELFVPLPAAIGERFAHWLIERCRSRPEA